jgi:hypothetical protein
MNSEQKPTFSRVGQLKFDGSSGRKPYSEARQYVLDAIITTLSEDICHAAYMHEDLEHEPDRRRAYKAATSILRALKKMAGR